MNLQGSYKFNPEAPEGVYYWQIQEQGRDDWEGDPDVNTGEIDSSTFCRASKQYDSVLFNSSQGCGWSVLTYTGANGEEAKAIKVYKPSGIQKILLHGYYIDPVTREQLPTTVEMDFSEQTTGKSFLAPSCIVTTLVFGSGSALPEIYEHTTETATASSSLFKERSHEMQINGSNFCVSINDYMDPSKATINGYEVRAIPNYCNISMTRTFQKFFIGGYRRYENAN